MHAHIHTASPAMRMATGSSPALFIGVDGSGLVLGETSSGPVSWQGDPSLLVPVSLFIPMLRSSLRKSLHPDPRWRVRIAGEPSDYGAASLEGLSHSGWNLSTTVFQAKLKWCSGSRTPWLVERFKIPDQLLCVLHRRRPSRLSVIFWKQPQNKNVFLNAPPQVESDLFVDNSPQQCCCLVIPVVLEVHKNWLE